MLASDLTSLDRDFGSTERESASDLFVAHRRLERHDDVLSRGTIEANSEVADIIPRDTRTAVQEGVTIDRYRIAVCLDIDTRRIVTL